MVAYFKRQNTLFMVLGALLGLGVVMLFYQQMVAPHPGYFRMFFILLPMLVGAVLGRLAASHWANRRLKQIYDLLYVQLKPEEFLREFAPLVAKVPDITIEYVDGKNKVAYAYEAMGDFARALECIASVDPDKLKLHKLAGTATTQNQRLRLLLLLERVEEAKLHLEQLRAMGQVALERAPALGRNIMECVRLAENWLLVLDGEPADEAYLAEEIELSKNNIHKSEMQLLLARAAANRGDQNGADELLLKALSTGKGLYAESKARQPLQASA